MRHFIILFASILSIISLNFSQAQPPRGRGQMPMDGILSGKVIDKGLNKPVEYANVVLYSLRDSSMITGAITNQSGVFRLDKLPYGRFYAEVKFIGYEKNTINEIKITPRAKHVKLDDILLLQSSNELDEVTIVADRQYVEYKIDKKVVNVSQMLTASGGTAVDALENVPSVTIDIEGNVSLRGSGEFTVLIDGRPSPLSGSDALQQIPASAIENIEIITNPSAKYDPEGVAGIINIVMKKQKLNGFSGVLNATVGMNDKYSTDALFNYKAGKFSPFIGAEWNDFNFDMTSELDRELYGDTENSFLAQHVDRKMNRGGYKVKAGTDIVFNDKNSVMITGEVGNFSFNRDFTTQTEAWTTSSLHDYTIIDDDANHGGDFYNGNIAYTKNFNTPGSKLEASVFYSYWDGDDGGAQEMYASDENWGISDLALTQNIRNEENFRTELRAKLDYTLPLSETSILEAGYQSFINKIEADYSYYDFDQPSKEWVLNSDFANFVIFDKNIQSAYATISGGVFDIQYKLGLRGEYTKRSLEQVTTNELYEIDRFDIFPTVHLSKQLPAKQQLQASYSRRIRRPNQRYLNPFPRYSDAYNYSSGNPNLNPEYVDSYELSYMKRFENSFISVEGFYRLTHDAFTRTMTIVDDGVLARSFDNINNEYAYGIELMTNTELTKWFSANVSGSVYRYIIDGQVTDTEVNQESTNWDARTNFTFKLPTKTRIQLNGMYRGPSVTLQGNREGFFVSSLAVRQDFFKRKASVTLKVRDIFSTGKHEIDIIDPSFKSHLHFERESPVVMLTFSYKINNFKEKRKSRGSGSDNSSDFNDDGY